MKKGVFHNHRTVVTSKIKEAFSSVLPIAAIMLILCFTVTPLDSGIFLAFIVGTISIIIGTGMFTLGADTGMTPIGQHVGTSVVKSKKLWLIIPIYFVVGVIITISEPDLMVLAEQLENTIGKWVLIIAIGIGVGVFLVIAFLRSLLKVKLSYILIFFYIAVFVLAFFVPSSFVPLAFDSGGVTTGPMSVPFIISIGTGVAAIRSDKEAEADGFGYTALCSIGPIISIMILGIILQPEHIETSQQAVPVINTSRGLMAEFAKSFPKYLQEVGIALLPIVAMFAISLIFGERMSKRSMGKIAIGMLYTYVGLVLFLAGVNFGFLPVGYAIGDAIGATDYAWIIIPIGMVIGFFVVAAEPSVHVLNKHVYEITEGAIPKKMLSISLMIGTAISVGLAMLRILLQIEIMYFLIPFYAVALILTFVVPDMFTGIAFDSGGVASGAMTTGFLLPLALGICRSVNGTQSIATLGFGVVAFVAMTPLVTIQFMGLYYKLKLKKLAKRKEEQKTTDEEIINSSSEDIIS